MCHLCGKCKNIGISFGDCYIIPKFTWVPRSKMTNREKLQDPYSNGTLRKTSKIGGKIKKTLDLAYGLLVRYINRRKDKMKKGLIKINKELKTEWSTGLVDDVFDFRDQIIDCVEKWKPNVDGYPASGLDEIEKLHTLTLKMLMAYSKWEGAIEDENEIGEKL